MRRLRPSIAVALLAAALGLAGCFGSTEPATQIDFDRATLNAHGTANAGDAHVYFEYWQTAHPESVLTSVGKDVPGGSSGDHSEPTASSYAGLTPGTQYSHRVCAKDSSAPGGACAQTRTFTTKRPAGDVVRGNYLTIFGGIDHMGTVDAHSDPSGANAGGTMTLPGDKKPAPGGTFEGNVTCLRVEGNRATVGAVGSDAGQPTTALFVIVDGGPNWLATQDKVDWTETPGTTPPDCSAGSFATLRDMYYSPVLVYDAP